MAGLPAADGDRGGEGVGEGAEGMVEADDVGGFRVDRGATAGGGGGRG